MHFAWRTNEARFLPHFFQHPKKEYIFFQTSLVLLSTSRLMRCRTGTDSWPSQQPNPISLSHWKRCRVWACSFCCCFHSSSLHMASRLVMSSLFVHRQRWGSAGGSLHQTGLQSVPLVHPGGCLASGECAGEARVGARQRQTELLVRKARPRIPCPALLHEHHTDRLQFRPGEEPCS